ncbi:MAG TPA: hypothetical protein VGE44_09430 [Daejeonella sp.]
MLKKLHKICLLILDLNSLEDNQAKVALQINQERINISAHKNGEWDFPIYSFQQHFVNLTYPMLDEVIKEIEYMIKYPYLR